MPTSSQQSTTTAKAKAKPEEEEPLKDDTNTVMQEKIKGLKKAATRSEVKGKEKESTTSPKKGKKATATATKGDSGDEESSVASATKKKRPKKGKKKATAKDVNRSRSDDEEPITKMAKKKASPKKASPRKRKAVASEGDSGKEEGKSPSSPKSITKKRTKKAKEPVQSITERDELPKLWSQEQAKESGSYTMKVCSWNVAGLRAVMRKDPDALTKLVTNYNLDVLCLQETKLQEMHLDDPKLKIRGHLLEEEGYDAYYSCSTAKKGYAGTAVFVKRRGSPKLKQKTLDSFFAARPPKEEEASTNSKLSVDSKLLLPETASYELGVDQHDKEGRVICLEFPGFTMTNVYVPNSGQKLDRLAYRTDEWDKDLVAFAKRKQEERGVPFMWLGDLNVAHKEFEAYNFGAKHLDKQAGLTPQERASFTEQLDAGFVDAFRHLHPTAKGHYSYWSQRAGNREPNKGLRLDYFVCDQSFFKGESKVIARDSYMISEQLCSDHCPVVLELEIKP